MTHLEKFGLPGPKALEKLLTTCTDPIAAIQNFQSENAIQLDSLHPALKLLDLHGVRRLEFHEQVLSDLQERLISRVQALGAASSSSSAAGTATNAKENTKMMENLLEKSFQLAEIPQIRPIVLETLKSLPKIPEKYLKTIEETADLYRDSALSVKQQLWLKKEPLFEKEITPLIDSYLVEKRKPLRVLESSAALYFSSSAKLRRHIPQIDTMVSFIGEHGLLYDRLLQYIRKGFIESGDVHYCSLRYELLMCLHEGGVRGVCDLDPCHSFAWCLDPCIREKHLDPKHAQEIKTFLDGIKRNPEPVWGDVCMVAGDPHVMDFFSSLALKVLHLSVSGEILPREQQSLPLIIRILSLGSSAWEAQKVQKWKEGKPDLIVYTKFLSTLCAMISQDWSRNELARHSADPTLLDSIPDEYAEIIQEDFARPPTRAVVDFLKTDRVAVYLWLYYCIDLAKKRDVKGLSLVLPTLSKCCDRLAYTEQFLHLFVSKMIHLNWREMMWSGSEAPGVSPGWEVCVGLLEKFLGGKTALAKEGTRWHCLTLLYHCGARMPPQLVETAMRNLNPMDLNINSDDKAAQSDEAEMAYGTAYNKVQQKIAAQKLEEASTSEPQENEPESVKNRRDSFVDFDVPLPTPK